MARKAKAIPQLVWEPFKLRIRQAYMVERATQKQLQDRFNSEFPSGHVPTKSQWKSQLARWNFTRSGAATVLASSQPANGPSNTECSASMDNQSIAETKNDFLSPNDPSLPTYNSGASTNPPDHSTITPTLLNNSQGFGTSLWPLDGLSEGAEDWHLDSAF
ncbi:MAG: hypothetical protein M1836_002167 [Candelina mexicana]|nr:MAG: hypothetical protein M1836_002167 [Candelina mexicana]